MAQYTVLIKPDCYRDEYSRNGIRFTKHTAVQVDEADMTDQIRSDPFLIVKRIGPEPRRTGETNEKP